MCACIWNNSWSAQREVIKKPDPVKANLGNNNQGISLNKIQPKQVWISFSDWSIHYYFFKLLIDFIKPLLLYFLIFLQQLESFDEFSGKNIKYETSSGFFPFHPTFCTMWPLLDSILQFDCLHQSFCQMSLFVAAEKAP